MGAWVGLWTFYNPMGLLNGLSWETGRFFHCPSPHWILQSKVIRIYFPSDGILGCMLWPGAGTACSPVVPPRVYLPHVNVELPILPASTTTTSPHLTAPLCHGCPSLPFRPIWMDVSSLDAWLSDFHTIGFSGNSSCFLFLDWLLPVLWLCEERKYVPMPPCWQSPNSVIQMNGYNLYYDEPKNDYFYFTLVLKKCSVF